MKRESQITDLDQLAGKTISRAMFLNGSDELGIVFDDGSFLRVGVYYWYDSADLSIDETLDFDTAVKMGLLSTDEIEEHEKAEEVKRKARELRDLENKVQLYEKLRRELGKEIDSTDDP